MSDGQPILLVLDYPGRRDEPAMSVMGLEAEGFDVRYLLDDPPAGEFTSATYAARLRDDQGPWDSGVAAVLAYCMAAPIAQEVARLTSEKADAPVPMVLLDAEPSTPATIARQYQVVAEQLREEFGAAGDTSLPSGVFAPALLQDQPREAVDRMRRGLVGLAVAGMSDEFGDAADPVDLAEVAEQLTDVYVKWLVHLVAACHTSWPEWGGDVLHVTSLEHWYRQDWPGAQRSTTRRMTCNRTELVQNSEVKAGVVAWLKGRALSG